MKIALINENSQAAKNELVESVLKKVVEPMGHEVVNYGMYSADDENQLTYVQNGILAAILLNSGAADYVVTGCGTGEGAMLACNSFPGVLCGHIVDPSDAYMFAQINDGNAIALPFAKGFGWGAELNLQYIFEKLFEGESGQGYPKERVIPEQRNKKILDEVKKIKQIVEEVKAELTSQEIAFGDVEQGIMIETPAAVMVSEALAKEVDFFSIGTNDLTQYTLAIDRQNPKLEEFYDPHHPAVLNMIRMTVENAHKAGIWAGICGELGADPELTKLFLSIGVDELSVSPSRVLSVRKTILETDVEKERDEQIKKWL